VDFVTYMDFVGGISWEKYYQYIDQQCGAKPYSSMFAMYVPFSNSVGQTVFFSKLQCSRRTYIEQQCGAIDSGANRVLSAKFCERNVGSGQQQCGVNRFRSVNFC